MQRNRQVWPWLRLGGRFNYRSLYDAAPYVYWYRADEAVSELKSVGFKVKGVASRLQMEKGQLVDSVEELLKEPMEGALYCVCVK
jgi:hypothetical protein